MKPYFALSLLAVMCCNVGAAEPQQTVVPHSADPILVTDGPQQDAALMNKAGLPPQPAEQPPAQPVQPPETTQATPPSAPTAALPQAGSQTDQHRRQHKTATNSRRLLRCTVPLRSRFHP